MGANSGISWTTHTFNPWWGCAKVSPGCANCYAEVTAKRFGTAWGHAKPRRFFGDGHWHEPVKWNAAARAAGERHRVFCGSMCDWAEDRADLDPHRERLWKLIEATPDLDWLLLTKRPGALCRLVPWATGVRRPLKNVWLGITVTTQAEVANLVMLMAVPARVHFVSCEPMLEPLDFGHWLMPVEERQRRQGDAYWRFSRQAKAPPPSMADPDAYEPELDWVIVGGESAVRSIGGGQTKARPFDVAAARTLCSQATAAGASVWFKQMGANPVGWTPPAPDTHNGEMHLWPEDLRVQELPKLLPW